MSGVERSQSLVEVDARRRVSLGSLAEYDRYFANVEEDGTIVLTPAVVMPAAEVRLYEATETAAEVDAFLSDPDLGVRRVRPSRRRRG
jgi:hypothetical protein